MDLENSNNSAKLASEDQTDEELLSDERPSGESDSETPHVSRAPEEELERAAREATKRVATKGILSGDKVIFTCEYPNG